MFYGKPLVESSQQVSFWKKIKVPRKLVKESIEVYPIKDFGAVEIVLHKRHNNSEKQGEPSYTSKFIIF
jgi:hypothetical protein